MSGQPSQQKFKVTLTTQMPSSAFNYYDVVNFLNSAGEGFWNGVVGNVIKLNNFTGYDVTHVSVSGAEWWDNNSHAQLTFYLNTTSDPITATQVDSVLGNLWGLLLVALGAALILIPVGGWALDLIGLIIAFAGALTLLSHAVTDVTGSIGRDPILNALFWGGIIVGGTLFVYSGYRYFTDKSYKRSIDSIASGTARRVATYVH